MFKKCCKVAIVIFSLMMICAVNLNAASKQENDELAKALISDIEKTYKPLEKEMNLTWWTASITGKDEDYATKEKLENDMNKILSNPETFKKIKDIRAKKIKDKLVKRQIDVLYLLFLEKQIDPKDLEAMTAKANAIEKKFNVFRATVDGKELNDGEIRKILKDSKDSDYRRKVWEATKEVGKIVEPELKELAKMRNNAAKKLGFRNYYMLQLAINEQNEKDLIKLFDELEKLTREPYKQMKHELDVMLAKNYGIAEKDIKSLRPWHYHDVFFQEAPAIYEVDLDKIYEKQDLVKLSQSFYSGIGLPVDDILKNSDFYEKKGKSPHAFCTDIDREGDVRILVNIIPNEYWMNTMLHELGHAVYSKNIPKTLPFFVRNDAAILMTEGIAGFFEKLAKNADWLEDMGIDVKDSRELLDKTNKKLLRNSSLIFARWSQVMLRFELALYENPDGDLNKIWWDIVEKYQMIPRPEGRNAPDYASKIHIITNPAYYHNYIMGDMFATQLHRTLQKKFAKDLAKSKKKSIYVDNPKIGEFLKTNVFQYGRSVDWNEIVKKATGEKLNAKGFASDLQKPI